MTAKKAHLPHILKIYVPKTELKLSFHLLLCLPEG
jgi:hypothetical protein